jgi:hypothetical protein
MGADFLQKGDEAPYDGFLFNRSEEKYIRIIKEDNLKLTDLNILKDKKIEKLNSSINDLNEKLEKRDLSQLQKIIYFGLGVLATGTSVWLAGKLVQR